MNDKLEKFDVDPFDMVQEYIFNKCKDELSYIRTEFMKWKSQIDELKQINSEINSILNAEIENSRNICHLGVPGKLAKVPNAPPSSPSRRLSWSGSNKQLAIPKPFRPESALATHGRRKRPDSRRMKNSSSSNEDFGPECIYEADNEGDDCKDCAFDDQKPLSSDAAKELLGDGITNIDEDVSNDSESGIVQSSDSETKSDEEKKTAIPKALKKIQEITIQEKENDSESSNKSDPLSDGLEDASTLSSRPNSPDHKPTVVECNDCACKNGSYCFCRANSYVETMNSRRLSLIHIGDLKIKDDSSETPKSAKSNVITKSFGNGDNEIKIKFSIKIKKVGQKKQKSSKQVALTSEQPSPLKLKPSIKQRAKVTNSDDSSSKPRASSPVFEQEALQEVTNRGDDLILVDEDASANQANSGGNKKVRFSATMSDSATA